MSLANSRAIYLSVLFFTLQRNGALLENGHPSSGQSNYPRTKREQPLSVSHQKFTSRTLMLAPAAGKTIPDPALCALSQMPVHSPSAHRSTASPLLQPHMPLVSHNRKKAFQNSVHKTCSGDLLDKHAIYFTEKKHCFTPRILKTSHQAFLVKYRYYNPPSRKRSSSLGRPSTKSAGINNKKREGLHRYWHQCYKLHNFVFKHIIRIITASHCAFNLLDF